MKVLIVDDVEFTRLIVEEALNILREEEELNFSMIKQAVGFKDAIRILQKDSFDIVITDLKLKDGLGTELANIIKHKHPKIKIVALTMYPKEFERIQENFDCFIKKPISPEELKERLTKLLK